MVELIVCSPPDGVGTASEILMGSSRATSEFKIPLSETPGTDIDAWLY